MYDVLHGNLSMLLPNSLPPSLKQGEATDMIPLA